MSSITLTQVTKVFVSKPVVDKVSLDVTSGEFLVLLGPSGCGKSTLLRMLAGLESLTSGEIHLGQRRVDALPPSARDMAFVFQSYALYPHMTVRRNMSFPLIMRQFKWWFHIPIIGHLAKRRIEASPEVSAMGDRTARILALTDMLDRYPRTLSGGQRQRVALGRAMVRQPEVFLMDEPLSNLDAKLRSSMRAEIIKLHRKLGGTFVYVTHDQIEAMTMGTRIVMMREGVVQQVGTPRDIYANPANTFVARFIGTPAMNLLLARMDAPQRQLEVGDQKFALPAHLASVTVGGSQDVLLGIRPNSLAIVDPQDKRGLAGTVSLVEHIGADSIITIKLDSVKTAHEGDSESDASDEIMLTKSGYSNLSAGSRVGVMMNLDHASIFSTSSGQRISTDLSVTCPVDFKN